MAVTTQLKNQHLLWRAGFGPAVEQLQDLSRFSPHEFYDALKKGSAKKPMYLRTVENTAEGLMAGIGREARMKKTELSPEERRIRQRQNRQGIRDLNIAWLKEMVNSGAQLREKLAFFWHDHFACRNLNVFYQQELLDVLRRNALGNFGTMLREVSRSAAMLNFLNNQQNRKGHPNENFAREVMELFTIGRGNYSETDVREAARAFTGWASNAAGEFVFRKGQHDNGTKTVLGKTGNLNGDDVLDILLESRKTAGFIAAKLYAFFVNEKINEAHVKKLADVFYSSDYEIMPVLDHMFRADWFYDKENIGARIKSPVELLAGMQRMVPMAIQNEDSLLVLQRVLGQVLFYPPNVAGWQGGTAWIDSSTLMLRLRLPQLFNDQDELNISPKDDDDQMMGRQSAADEEGQRIRKQSGKSMQGRGMKLINANLEWAKMYRHLEKTPREKLLNNIAGILMQTGTAVNEKVVMSYVDSGSREDFIRSATIQLMSTPEYQLC